jgi:small ligand-binding sensory domain FIST
MHKTIILPVICMAVKLGKLRWAVSENGLLRKISEPKDRKAVTQLRQLVAGFTPRAPGIAPKSVRVGFVTDELARDR